MRSSAKILGATLLFLGITTCIVWYAVLREDHHRTLKVTFLAVGQGDATLVETPSGRRILIDGGPDDEVLRQLGEAMPFYARSIDLVVATAQAPQKVGGLASVLSRYDVAVVARSAARSSAPQVQAFVGVVSHAQQNGTRLLILQRGQVISLGDATYIEVFFPDRDASDMSASDGCLAFKLVYGDTSFFFACGSAAIENYLATLDGTKLKSDVLLATGEDPELLAGFVSPQFAVIPCGASATSSMFSILQIQTLDTCSGTVTFLSDGQTVTEE
jgi:competence protein ComEC